MISGYDTIIPAVADAASLAGCLRVLRIVWPVAKFEDALTGDKYSRPDDIPERVAEVFVYRDEAAEAAWDINRDESSKNSMVYVLLSSGSVILVSDNPETKEMQTIIEAIRDLMQDRLSM